MKLIAKMRIYYHLKKTEKALLSGNKDKYKKHATMVHRILWNTVNEPKI